MGIKAGAGLLQEYGEGFAAVFEGARLVQQAFPGVADGGQAELGLEGVVEVVDEAAGLLEGGAALSGEVLHWRQDSALSQAGGDDDGHGGHF